MLLCQLSSLILLSMIGQFTFSANIYTNIGLIANEVKSPYIADFEIGLLAFRNIECVEDLIVPDTVQRLYQIPEHLKERSKQIEDMIVHHGNKSAILTKQSKQLKLIFMNLVKKTDIVRQMLTALIEQRFVLKENEHKKTRCFEPLYFSRLMDKFVSDPLVLKDTKDQIPTWSTLTTNFNKLNRQRRSISAFNSYRVSVRPKRSSDSHIQFFNYSGTHHFNGVNNFYNSPSCENLSGISSDQETQKTDNNRHMRIAGGRVEPTISPFVKPYLTHTTPKLTTSLKPKTTTPLPQFDFDPLDLVDTQRSLANTYDSDNLDHLLEDDPTVPSMTKFKHALRVLDSKDRILVTRVYSLLAKAQIDNPKVTEFRVLICPKFSLSSVHCAQDSINLMDIKTLAEIVNSPRSSYTHQDSYMSDDPNAYKHNKHASLNSQNRRDKRAVMGFMGDVYKFLFGVATEDDIANYQEVIDRLNSRMDYMSHFVVQAHEKLVAAVELQENRITNMTDQLNKNLGLINEKIVMIGSMLEQLTKQNSQFNSEISALDFLFSIELTVMQIWTSVDIIQDELSRQKDIYDKVDSMVRFQFIDNSIFKVDKLAAKITELLRTTNSKYMYPHDLPIFSLLSMGGAKVDFSGDKIQAAIKVPLILLDSSFSTYRLFTLPFLLTSKTMVETQSLANYIMIDKINRRFLWISDEDFLKCSKGFSPDCVSHKPWRMIVYDSCIVPALLSEKYVLGDCSLIVKEKPLSLDTVISIVRYDDCKWALSLLDNEVEIQQTCRQKSGDYLTQTATMTGLSTLNLQPGCEAYIEGFSMICHSALDYEHLPAANKLDFTPVKDPVALTIEESVFNIDQTIPFSNNLLPNTSSIISQIKSGKMQIIRTHEATKIKNLLSITKNATAKFISEDEYRSETIKELIEAIPDGDTSWWRWFMDVFVIFNMACFVLLFVVLLIRSRARGIQGLSALFMSNVADNKAGYVSAGLVKNNRSMNVNKFDFQGDMRVATSHEPRDNAFDLFTNANLSQLSQIYHNLTFNDTLLYRTFSGVNIIHEFLQSHFWYTVIFMILCHIVFLCYSNRIVRRELHRLRVSVGVLPNNRSAIRYGGECTLCGSFLVSFQNLFGTKSHDLVFQSTICTLPGCYDEWGVIIKESEDIFIEPQFFKRWYNHVTFNVAWGRLCLRSADNLAAETCHQLPTKITLLQSEITEQLADLGISWWYRGTIKSVTRVSLRGYGYYRDLYYNSVPLINIDIINPDNISGYESIITPDIPNNPILRLPRREHPTPALRYNRQVL